MPQVLTMLCRYGVALTLGQDALIRLKQSHLSCEQLIICNLDPDGSLF
jgi:hypothetical protein